MLAEMEQRKVSVLSVGVDEKAREGAVFVGISSMNFAPVQLYAHLVPYVQMQDNAVWGVVIVLICILSDCTGPYLTQKQERNKDRLTG